MRHTVDPAASCRISSAILMFEPNTRAWLTVENSRKIAHSMEIFEGQAATVPNQRVLLVKDGRSLARTSLESDCHRADTKRLQLRRVKCRGARTFANRFSAPWDLCADGESVPSRQPSSCRVAVDATRTVEANIVVLIVRVTK